MDDHWSLVWMSLNFTLGVSKNRWFSTQIIHFNRVSPPFWGTTIFENTHFARAPSLSALNLSGETLASFPFSSKEGTHKQTIRSRQWFPFFVLLPFIWLGKVNDPIWWMLFKWVETCWNHQIEWSNIAFLIADCRFSLTRWHVRSNAALRRRSSSLCAWRTMCFLFF